MSKISDKNLHKDLNTFVVGLLEHLKIKHSGNCHAMCRILKPYLSACFEIETFMMNCKVKQGRKMINHYYLIRVKDGMIIDGTASQFNDLNGEKMPQVFIGKKPKWYINQR